MTSHWLRDSSSSKTLLMLCRNFLEPKCEATQFTWWRDHLGSEISLMLWYLYWAIKDFSVHDLQSAGDHLCELDAKKRVSPLTKPKDKRTASDRFISLIPSLYDQHETSFRQPPTYVAFSTTRTKTSCCNPTPQNRQFIDCPMKDR